MKKCSIKNCENVHKAKGLCSKHYKQSNRDKMNSYNRKYYKENKYFAAKKFASRKNKTFNLSEELYLSLLDCGCYYCGTKNLETYGISLDRIDNLKGYTEDNVIPCCGKCNRLRGDQLTVKETYELIQLLKTLRQGIVWK